MLLAVGILALAEYLPFEVPKCDHDNCDVVERLPIEAVLKNALDCQATLLMD